MFPRFPPTIYPAAFCIGVIASFRLPETGRFWLWAGLFAVLSGWLLRAWRQGCGVQAAAFALWLAIGAGYGIARTQYALSQQVPPQNRVQPVRLVLTVSGLPEQDAQGRVRFEGRAETEDGRRYTLVFSDYAGREWHAGEVWQVQARVKAAVGMRNAAGFDAEAQALANGWDGSATLGAQRFRLPENGWRRFSPDAWRARINAGWMRAAARFPDGAGLMSALAVGSRAALSAETQAALRPLGLNHLVSISGLHIGMVAWLAAWLVQRLLLLLPKMPVSPRGWAAAAGVAAAVFYAALAGFGVPALRSVAMVAVFALAWARQRAAGAWQAWQLAMAAVLALQPAAALSAGFWLSFGLVGALLWVSAFRLPEKQSWRAKLKTAVRAQWAATLAGGVGTVALFGLLPVFSPLANAVAIPLFSWLLVPLALVCSILPWDMPKLFAAQIGEWVAHAVRYAGARLPDVAFAQAPAPLVAAAAVAVLLVLLPAGARLKPLACCALAAFALYRPSAFEGSLNMTVFDVGQGLSVLMQTRSQNILFDTGTAYAAETALLPNLRALGVRRLHLLVLSHADDDHDGGFSAVRQRYAPEKIAAGQPENYPAARHCTGSPCRGARRQTTMQAACCALLREGTHWLSRAIWGKKANANWRRNTAARCKATCWCWDTTAAAPPPPAHLPTPFPRNGRLPAAALPTHTDTRIPKPCARLPPTASRFCARTRRAGWHSVLTIAAYTCRLWRGTDIGGRKNRFRLPLPKRRKGSLKTRNSCA